MTGQERIDWLCRLRSFLTQCGMPKEWRTNFHQALSDVIKSLEQKPCEKFDRKDVIDALKICDCNYECVGCEECPIKDKNYNGSWSDDNGDCYIQLMHRAAELLSVKQEPCDDAISREDVLMALTGEWTDSTDELIHRFIRRIRTLPSVTQQKDGFESKQRIIDAITAKIDEIDDEKPDVIIGLIIAIGVIKNLPDATENKDEE